MGLFGKKKKRKVSIEDTKKVITKDFSYHPKIILAWAKAIEGNNNLLDYLNKQNLKELVMATHAIRLKDKARDWLMKNGYPHVMAMINASEGNRQAMEWLKMNDFEVFYNMARAIDDEPEGFVWLKENATQDIFLLTKSIKKVKDEIEETHNDIHMRSRD